ncbi:2-hydroxyacid dehydrogenase [Rhodobacteraceae bacterium NNCM2]|nr:2-hydroxyacid dehydrogenase [Coraliihabitans acroporae]
MKPEIIMIGPMLKTAMDDLEATYTVHRYWEAADKPALLAEIGPRIRAIATDGHSGVPTEVFEACPGIELIASFGVGYDNIDIPTAKARGIRVTTTPDVLNDAMAEITIGLMIALARKLPQADQWVRNGNWVPGQSYGLTSELTGATVGILGLGRIGKEIATRAQAMKMRVVYHGRREQPHLPYAYYADLEEMARDVDWLVVIAPGSAETKGIVSRKVLEALGPKGRLVNVARGTLIDEPAMVEMLSSGALGGAALDVFEVEPHVPGGLMALDNVVLSPHQGSATDKTRYAMGDLVVGNMAAHFAGEPLLSPLI